MIRFAPAARDGTITLTSGELTHHRRPDHRRPGRQSADHQRQRRQPRLQHQRQHDRRRDQRPDHRPRPGQQHHGAGPLGPVTLGGGILNTGAHVTLSGVTLADNQAVASQTGYVQTNLISDIPGLAQLTDPNLKDPWGTSFSDTGLFSVSDTKTNVSTLYAVTAAGVSPVPPTVAIPTTATGSQGPTGQVHNETSSFLVNGTPATFIYANLNGTISAWNSSAGTTAQVMAAPSGAGYQGLDIASTAVGRLPLRRQRQAGEDRRLQQLVRPDEPGAQCVRGPPAAGRAGPVQRGGHQRQALRGLRAGRDAGRAVIGRGRGRGRGGVRYERQLHQAAHHQAASSPRPGGSRWPRPASASSAAICWSATSATSTPRSTPSTR